MNEKADDFIQNSTLVSQSQWNVREKLQPHRVKQSWEIVFKIIAKGEGGYCSNGETWDPSPHTQRQNGF